MYYTFCNRVSCDIQLVTILPKTSPLKVCDINFISGRGSTSVTDHSYSLRIDVDMSGCGFVKIPTITTSLEGRSDHSKATDYTNVDRATTSEFYVYIRHPEFTTGTRLIDKARYYKWNLEWVAVGYTC